MSYEFETDVLEDYDFNDSINSIIEVVVEYEVEEAEPENGLMDDYYGYHVFLYQDGRTPLDITDDLTLKDHSNIYNACKAHFTKLMESQNDFC
jgi:hypothetical protein